MNILGALVNILVSILIGALVGWIASKIMHTGGTFVQNAILGIIGGFVAGIILPGWLGIIGSVIGACLVIWLYNKFIKK